MLLTRDTTSNKQSVTVPTMKNCTVENLETGEFLSDTLIRKRKARKNICDEGKCLGSLMNQKPKNKPLTSKEIESKAKDFFEEYFAEDRLEDHFICTAQPSLNPKLGRALISKQN